MRIASAGEDRENVGNDPTDLLEHYRIGTFKYPSSVGTKFKTFATRTKLSEPRRMYTGEAAGGPHINPTDLTFPCSQWLPYGRLTVMDLADPRMEILSRTRPRELSLSPSYNSAKMSAL